MKSKRDAMMLGGSELMSTLYIGPMLMVVLRGFWFGYSVSMCYCLALMISSKGLYTAEKSLSLG